MCKICYQILDSFNHIKHVSPYMVRYGRLSFKRGDHLIGWNKRYIRHAGADTIKKIEINGKTYAIKYIGHCDREEWRQVRKMIQEEISCPYLINYYACLRSSTNNWKYVLMDLANMDLSRYLDEYDVIINRQFIMKILKLCLNFTQWCIDNLGKVHIDIKTKNILVQFNQDGSRFDLKFVDLGLMEDAGNHYQPDKDMLREKSYENELYPRKNCNFQQFVLFSLAIMMLDIKGYDIEKLVGRTNDKKIPKIINQYFLRMPTIKAYLKKFITFKFNGIKSAHKRLAIIEKMENFCKN